MVNETRLADSIEAFRRRYVLDRRAYEEEEREWKDELVRRFRPVFARESIASRSFVDSLRAIFHDSSASQTIVWLGGGAYFQRARFGDLLDSEPEHTMLSELFSDLLHSRGTLAARINTFKGSVDSLYESLPRDGTIQLNLISQFLGLSFPDRYYVYKYTEFDRAVRYFEYGVEQTDTSAGGKYEYYLGFVQEIRNAMVAQGLEEVDFIDVQTFVNRDDWYMPADEEKERDKYEEEVAEEQSLSLEQLVQRVRESSSKPPRVVHTTQYHRDRSVAALVKQDAQGVCDLCGQRSPFQNRAGRWYLESHHVIYLSDGGDDSIGNSAALCPNCHAKMHVLNLDGDRDKLLVVARERQESLFAAHPPA